MKPIQKISRNLLLICSLFLFLMLPVRTSAATAPSKVKDVTCGVTTKSSINLSWTGQFQVSGYQIYRSLAYNGKYKKIKDINPEMNAFCNKKLTAGKEYYYKVRSYIRTEKGVVYGKFSKILKAHTKMPSKQNAVVRIRANIRKNAGTKYPITATVDAGTQVSIICTTQDKSGDAWSYISCKDKNRTIKGYIYSNLLQSQNQLIKQMGQVTASRLNVRSNPGTSNPVIASLKKGKKVTILGQIKSPEDGSIWYLVQFKQNGIILKGYVSARYIKLV